MAAKFVREFPVQYYQVNQHKELKLVSLLNDMESSAIAHSEKVGYGIRALEKRGCGWVLNRWAIEINYFPQLGEKIVIETWPSKFERFYATREFSLIDKHDRMWGKATSRWVFLNTEIGRPVRIPLEIVNAYGITTERALDREFTDLKVEDNPNEYLSEVQSFDVRRSDIDTNNHVNNSKYLEWILETIPQTVYDNYLLESLEIVYKKAAKYGDKIKVTTQDTASDPGEMPTKMKYIHHIDGNGQNDCLANSVWKKRT